MDSCVYVRQRVRVCFIPGREKPYARYPKLSASPPTHTYCVRRSIIDPDDWGTNKLLMYYPSRRSTWTCCASGRATHSVSRDKGEVGSLLGAMMNNHVGLCPYTCLCPLRATRAKRCMAIGRVDNVAHSAQGEDLQQGVDEDTRVEMSGTEECNLVCTLDQLGSLLLVIQHSSEAVGVGKRFEMVHQLPARRIRRDMSLLKWCLWLEPPPSCYSVIRVLSFQRHLVIPEL